MTLRALARGSVLITLANLVPRLGTFLLLPLYARALTQGEFGIVSLAASGALLGSIALRLGLDAALLRLHHEVDGERRRALYATVVAMSLVTITGVAGSALVIVALGVDDEPTRDIAMLAIALGALGTFQYLPSVWFRAREEAGKYLALALAAFALVAVTTVLLVVVLRLGAVGSLLGQMAGAILTAVVAATIAWRLWPWRLDRHLGRQALRFGLPLVPHTLAGWVLNVSDRWLLGLMLPIGGAAALAAVGVYSVGYQLGYAIALVATSFSAAWLPFLYRHAGSPALPTLLRDGTTVLIGGFAALAAGVAILAPDLVALVAPPSWAAAADVTRIVALGSALNAAAILLAGGLYVARRTTLLPVLTLAAGAVNVVANLVLIPRAGISGAAWATLAAYGSLAVLTAVLARRAGGTELDLRRLALVTVLAAAGTAVSAGLAVIDGPAGPVSRLALAAGSAVLIAIVVTRPARRVRESVRPTDRPPGGPGEVG